jgi:hypothetical protein
MRYLIRARLKPGKSLSLLASIENETLGAGSVAEGEYVRVMGNARQLDDGDIQWVEVCYCEKPLAEERPFWEEFFELVDIKDAHNRLNCRDSNGSEPYACEYCDCTQKLEIHLAGKGEKLLDALRKALHP